MRILFAASEIFPYAKSGGLADVGASLPKALRALDHDVVSVMPLYSFIAQDRFEHNVFEFEVMLGGVSYNVHCHKEHHTYFIEAPLLSTTSYMYGEEGRDYADNDLRFGLFGAAVVMLSRALHVEILHLNDWHSALATLWIKAQNLPIKSVFTIHNLAYQGLFEKTSLRRLGLGIDFFTPERIEFYGKVSFMKAGIAYADTITTVSPNYAKEILTPEFGCGLEGFLRLHVKKLTGVLNGIDTDTYNPVTDTALMHPYSVESLALKEQNKKALYRELGMKDSKKPLFVMISRLVHQKGIDLLIKALDSLLKKPLELLILGDDSGSYRNVLEKASAKHPNLKLIFGYDEALSHRIYAGADFLLMPSIFEPCGLNQMIAMRYGTIPIVHNVGGLHDTVHETHGACGWGIRFNTPSSRALLGAVDRALKLEKEVYLQMQNFNMNCDFSFAPGAKSYHHIYRNLLAKDAHV